MPRFLVALFAVLACTASAAPTRTGVRTSLICTEGTSRDVHFFALGRAFDLVLKPQHLFAPDAFISAEDSNDEAREIDSIGNLWWSGVEANTPGSFAQVTCEARGSVTGTLFMNDKTYEFSSNAKGMVLIEEAAQPEFQFPMVIDHLEAQVDEALLRQRQNQNRTRRAAGDENTCRVYIDIDKYYYADYGVGSTSTEKITAAIQRVLLTMAQVDALYAASGVARVLVSGIKVHTTLDTYASTSVTNLISYSKWVQSTALTARGVGASGNPDLLCLNTLFTSKAWNSAAVGIAWVGSVNGLGGVCENINTNAGEQLNTAIANQKYTFNGVQTVPTQALTLIFSHELGHAFGAQHDCCADFLDVCASSNPESCTSQNGQNQCNPLGNVNNGQNKFLMYPLVSSGANSNSFSTCSKSDISAVINANGACLIPYPGVTAPWTGWKCEFANKDTCETTCESFGPSFVFTYRTQCSGCKCVDFSKFRCGISKTKCVATCKSLGWNQVWRESVNVAGKTCRNACKCVPKTK